MIEARELVLLAYGKHPERFVRSCPKKQALPTAVWINPPPIKANDDNKKRGSSGELVGHQGLCVVEWSGPLRAIRPGPGSLRRCPTIRVQVSEKTIESLRDEFLLPCDPFPASVAPRRLALRCQW